MSTQDDSDVSPGHGLASPALNNRLARLNLSDLGPLLKAKGVCTLEGLLDMDAMERAAFATKAKLLLNILGQFSSNLVKQMNRLFDAEGVPVGEIGSVFLQPLQPRQPLQPGVVAANSGASSSSSSPQVPPLQVQGLPPHYVDDTACTQGLPGALATVLHLVGQPGVNDCVRHLGLSGQLSAESAAEAALALACVKVTHGTHETKEIHDLVKAAKCKVRDVVLWRCAGHVLGLDSKPALIRSFEAATAEAACDSNVSSQLQNALRRTLEGLGQQQPQRRARSPAQDRPEKTAPKQMGIAESGIDSPTHAFEPMSITPMCAPEPDWVMPGCLGYGLPAPPGLESTVLGFLGSAIVGSRGRSTSSCATGRPRGISRGISQPPLESMVPGFLGSASCEISQPTRGHHSDLPSASGDVSACMVKFLLEKLSSADSAEECMQCASWLASAYSYTATNRDEELVHSIQAALVSAVQHHTADQQVMQQVLMALARIAGAQFPFIEFDLNTPGFWMAVSKTWSCLLTEGHGRFKEFFERSNQTILHPSEGRYNRNELVRWTIGLSSQFNVKMTSQLAMLCCESLGALCWTVKDDVAEALTMEKRLVRIIEEFRGYPHIVHAGLVALVKLCLASSFIFGMCLRPSSHCCGKPISDYLRQHVKGLVITVEACSDFPEDTFDVAIKLLVHVYPLDEIIRFMAHRLHTSAKGRCWRKLSIIVQQLQATFQEDKVLAQDN